jgi:uncharacterized membrane protein
MKLSVVAKSAILAAAALLVDANPSAAATPTAGEKCYGIAKAGLNDCQTASHSCAGASTKDGDTASWVYVPIGTCQKIAGGSAQPRG